MPIEQTHDAFKPTATERGELLRRAKAAWFSTGGTEAPNERSSVKLRLGLVYIVLHGESGVLVVYRARTDNGLLRRMKRWPASIEK